MKKIALWLGLAVVGASLSFSPPAGAAAPGLTQAEAELRARQLGQVSYQIELKLDPAKEQFDGTTTLHFDLNAAAGGDGVFAELEGAQIAALKLNDVALTAAQVAARYDGHRIRMTTQELKPQGNQLVVTYSRAYVSSGNGLQRFKDVADGRLYHYNHFEAYYAHLVFPCFDQPDLKAPIDLKVEAPSDWVVIASTPAEPPTDGGLGKIWTFARTPRLSTYVLTLAAGPFKIWSGHAGATPLRLLARQSMAQYIDADEWLTITQQAIAFYAKEFSSPYPYHKLDLILVPDFPAGATENLAGITLGERGTVFRSKQTPSAYVQRASILSHEIAHMWFGDLVTMRWWNGLWLNESFAALMEALAVAEATKYREDAWPYFYSDYKRWAYREDQLVTTHPIELAVADTDQARAIFDGITYGKGASVLKQLRYYLGADKFRDGLKLYFHQHAYANTTLEDFMGALSQAAHVDLRQWQKLWLQSAGLNTVQAQWECRDGRVANFSLHQSAPADYPTLRPHRTQIGLYYLGKDRLTLHAESVVAAAYAGAETPVPEVVGKPCPALVFPNQNDQDYVKVELDPVSLVTVQSRLHGVADRLGRQMLWWALFDMLRDARLAPAAYVDTVLKQLAQESDPQILADVLGRLGRDLIRYIAPPKRGELRTQIERFVKSQLAGAAPGSDRQLLYFKSYLGTAFTAAAESYLQALLADENLLPGIKLSQDRRWGVVQALSRLGAKNAAALIATELRKDATNEGRKGSFNAEAQLPDSKTKAKWFQRITRSSPQVSENQLDAGDLREAMGQFAMAGQEQLLAPFTDRYFQELAQLSARGEDNMYLQRMSDAMYPVQCEPAVIAKTTAFLSAHPELPAGVLKSLRIKRQEVEICLKVQAL